MRYAFALLLIVLIALPEVVCAQSRATPQRVGLSGIADTVESVCDRADILSTFTKANDATVRRYGEPLLSRAWACRKLSTHWLTTGRVIRLHESTSQLDDSHEMTLLLIPGDRQPWAIPTMEGMTEPPGLANARHNRVAFDALVRANHERPTTPAGWVSLALLYLNVIGQDVRVADSTQFGSHVRGLLSRSRKLRRFGLLPTYVRYGKFRTVVVNDLYGSAQTDRYTRWTLTFVVHARGVWLSKVERETAKLPLGRLERKGR